MNDNQRVVYTFGLIAQALITAMGYQAENEMRKSQGWGPAYSEGSFQDLIRELGINHNDLIINLTGEKR